MNARTIGKLALAAAAITAVVLLLITGPFLNSLKKDYEKRGFFESVGAEFNGKADSDRELINNVAALNKFLIVGIFVLGIVGGGALLVARNESQICKSP